uniref:Uncharacterized protein n=1 Tax=Anguilla anguilla TaxID=7936 RepID=A0A0E9TUB1_ANGAN
MTAPIKTQNSERNLIRVL